MRVVIGYMSIHERFISCTNHLSTHGYIVITPFPIIKRVFSRVREILVAPREFGLSTSPVVASKISRIYGHDLSRKRKAMQTRV